jgi:hypothetical protein
MRRIGALTLACAALVSLVTLASTPAEGNPRAGRQAAPSAGAGGAASHKGLVKLLHKAREIAHKAPHKYNGHRARAIHHIDHAIKQLHEAGTGKGKGKAKAKARGKVGKAGRGKVGKGGTSPANATQMHDHHAVEQMDHAIHQLQEGIKYYHAHHPGTTSTGGLRQALKLVTEARQAATKK